MKNKINICVMSRLEALNYCNTIQNEPSAIISISTPHNDYEYSVFKSKTNMVSDILELCFFDADEQRSIDIADDYAVTRELMTDKDAKLITEFVDKYKDILLIVHCDEGVSRSAGIAAAILRHYTGDDAQIFDNVFSYNPNMWCYFKVLKAFGDEI